MNSGEKRVINPTNCTRAVHASLPSVWYFYFSHYEITSHRRHYILWQSCNLIGASFERLWPIDVRQGADWSQKSFFWTERSGTANNSGRSHGRQFYANNCRILCKFLFIKRKGGRSVLIDLEWNLCPLVRSTPQVSIKEPARQDQSEIGAEQEDLEWTKLRFDYSNE